MVVNLSKTKETGLRLDPQSSLSADVTGIEQNNCLC